MDEKQQPPYNILELGAKFGAQEAQMYGQIITLEKRIEILETSIAQLQAEIVDLNPLRATMSRESAGYAEEGRAIIRESQKSRPD